MGYRAQPRGLVAIELSLVAHGVVALVIGLARPELPTFTGAHQETTVEFQIEERSAPVQEPLPVVPPQERSVPRPMRVPRRVIPSPVATISDSVSVPDVTVERATVEPATVERDRETVEPIEPPSLDPRSVASRMVVGPGPVQEGPPATADDSAAHAPTPLREALATVEASLVSATGGHEAFSERPYRVVQRPDGAYHYEGIGFEGIIEPDGSIRTEDRPAFGFNPATGEITFDLTDMAMRAAGQDPYTSERLGFLDATEELRGRLEDEARAERLARSLRRLGGHLARIWQDETRTPAERRRALFEIWDDCADGESGAAARAIVIAFVRDERAFSEDITYGPAELARLNASRLSVERFAPQ